MLCRAHECYIQAAAAPISVERLALAATRCVRTTETCVLVRYTAGGVMCTAWGQSHMNYKKAVTFRVRSPRDVVTRCHRRPQGDCKGTCRRRRSDAMCTQSTDFKKFGDSFEKALLCIGTICTAGRPRSWHSLARVLYSEPTTGSSCQLIRELRQVLPVGQALTPSVGATLFPACGQEAARRSATPGAKER